MRIVLAVDVSHWLRPDAPASDERLFCHVYGRWDRRSDQFVPGWPYFFVAALERGRTSWGALLDVRLGPLRTARQATPQARRRPHARSTWHTPDLTTPTRTTRYGTAEPIAWDRMHPRLAHSDPWLDHAREKLPISTAR
ncbi:transposase [Streptomyces sp. NPDC001966]